MGSRGKPCLFTSVYAHTQERGGDRMTFREFCICVCVHVAVNVKVIPNFKDERKADLVLISRQLEKFITDVLHWHWKKFRQRTGRLESTSLLNSVSPTCLSRFSFFFFDNHKICAWGVTSSSLVMLASSRSYFHHRGSGFSSSKSKQIFKRKLKAKLKRQVLNGHTHKDSEGAHTYLRLGGGKKKRKKTCSLNFLTTCWKQEMKKKKSNAGSLPALVSSVLWMSLLELCHLTPVFYLSVVGWSCLDATRHHQNHSIVPSSQPDKGEKNVTKSWWVEIATGRSLAGNCHGQNRLGLGKLI